MELTVGVFGFQSFRFDNDHIEHYNWRLQQ